MPKPKKITLDDLGASFQNLSGTTEKLAQSIEDLVIMTQNGFTEMHSEMNTRFDKVEERLDRIENILLRSLTIQSPSLKMR